MEDKVFEGFLRRQVIEGMALSRESDILTLTPAAGDPPQRYLATFRCKGLVRETDGAITEASEFVVGIFFPSDYCRRADPVEVVRWLGPRNVFHPNISDRFPVICIGRLNPADSLTSILDQVYSIITYQKATLREDDALNADACAWARRNPHRFPVDRRPLKRRPLNLRVTVTSKAAIS